MLRMSGVSGRSCQSCQESELRPPAAREVLPAMGLALYRAWGRVGLSAIAGRACFYIGSKNGAVTFILIGRGCGGRCVYVLSSYVNGTSESWLQGSACKEEHGRWEIHTLTPWRRG